MSLIDTHAHLFLEDFRHDIADVIDRARSNGISHIILPNIDASSLAPMLNLTAEYPGYLIPLAGLHPGHVKDNYREELEKIFQEVDLSECRAIGEIGIDLYWDKSFAVQQMEAFEYQLSMAMEHHLPVVIHARDSFEEIIRIISHSRYAGLSGIFHAYTGDKALAFDIIDRGFLLGIGGILTFKKSHLPEIVREISMGHMVLETDSPYLTPAPNRGKRNESSFLVHIARRLAEIKGLHIDEVAAKTSANAKRIFRL